MSKDQILELDGFKVGELVTYHSPPSGPATSGPHKLLELRRIGEDNVARFKGRAGYVKLVCLQHYDGPADGRSNEEHLEASVKALRIEVNDLTEECERLVTARDEALGQAQSLEQANQTAGEKIAQLESQVEARDARITELEQENEALRNSVEPE